MTNKPKVHYLKTIQPFFGDVRSRKKPFELRLNDRDFQEGEIIVCSEFDKERGHTGQTEVRQITYVLKGGIYGLAEDYCILGLKDYLLDPVGQYEENIEAAHQIHDLRLMLRTHPDQEMVTASCLHFLGDEVQEWWNEKHKTEEL